MESDRPAGRREFLETTGAAITSASLLSAQTGDSGEVPRRPLGNTGLQVSIVGVGGYGIRYLRRPGRSPRIVGTAIDAGINFSTTPGKLSPRAEAKSGWGKRLKGKRDRVDADD